MKSTLSSVALLAAIFVAQSAVAATEPTPSATSSVRITEVAPWSSGNSPVGDDWFELTNTGSISISISGWKIDDNSYAFGNAVALNGVTTIAAHESVIFIETSGTNTAAGNLNAFVNTWFGGNKPAGLKIGSYTGNGVGLSSSSDAVTVFDSTGAVQAVVAFGASPIGPYATFDNAIGQNGGTISTLSAIGANGAFKAVGDATEIGSPGTIAAVPEPESYAMLLAGLGLMGFVARRRSK